jgi:hypothetical protein
MAIRAATRKAKPAIPVLSGVHNDDDEDAFLRDVRL